MKLVFAGQTLASDADLVWVGGDSLSSTLESALDELPAAETVRIRDLGNASTEFVLSATREHSSRLDAEYHYLTHGQSVIGQGDAVIAPGSGQPSRYLRSAILSARGVSLRGLTTVFEYTLLAGLVTGLVVGGLRSGSIARAPATAATASADLTVSHLASSSVLRAPAAAVSGAASVSAPHLASASVLRAPAVAAAAAGSVVVPHLASSSALRAPTVAAAAAGSVTVPHVASSSALRAPLLLDPIWTDIARIYKLEDRTEELGNADLTVSSAPVLVAGRSGNAYHYDGSNDHHQSDYYASGVWSIGGWINADAIAADLNGEYCFGSHDNSDHRFYIGLVNNDEFIFGAGDQFAATDGESAAVGTWYHVLLTYDGSTAKGYVNGVEVSSFAAGFSGASSVPARIGGRSGDNGQVSWYFDGRVDEVYIWSRALSAAEAATLYNSGSGTFYP